MGKELHTVKQILKAIENSGGIKTNVAKKLSISRQTVDRYQRVYPSIAKALEEEMDTVLDKAESNIFSGVQEGDIPISQWILRYKGKHRGYSEKLETEINGKDGNELKIKFEMVEPKK
jgi:hypothetical protein